MVSDSIYNEGGNVPLEYNDLMMFWDKFSPNSYEDYLNIDFIILGKIKAYKEAEAHGQERLKTKPAPKK